MLRSIIQAVFKRSSDDLGRVLQLLGPNAIGCLFCGKNMKSNAPSNRSTRYNESSQAVIPKSFFQSVCRDCSDHIPWLTSIRCRICGRGVECSDCQRRIDPQFIMNRSAVQYSSVMREWLAQYKYRGNENLELLLAQMLFPAYTVLTREAAIREPLVMLENRSFCWDAITYVPVSPERAEERGFNQAERLATILSRQYHMPLAHLLIRERHTEKQSFKTRSERMQNTNRLFRAIPEQMASLQHAHSRSIKLLLIDDIYTTGSTIQACAEALHRQSSIPLDIFSLTWARS
ncbi:MAG: ComF family protein [Candidatus Pristimantibacillus sp.]